MDHGPYKVIRSVQRSRLRKEAEREDGTSSWQQLLSTSGFQLCFVQSVMARYQKLRTRYDALTARATAGGSLVPDTAYADFLK